MGVDAGNKDFRGKDLRGRSFKGQNLAGADFSDAQLGGVNFSGADLTGAKFCRAVMGHSRWGKLALLGRQLPLGLLAGFGMAIASLFFAVYLSILFEELFAVKLEFNDWRISGIMGSFSILSAFSICLAVHHNRLNVILGANGLLLILFVAAGAVVAVAGAVAVALAVALAGAGAGAGFMTVVFLLMAIYLTRRAIEREEPQLALLRRWHIFFNSLGTTRFSGQIRDADFTDANLQYAHFDYVTLQNCIWLGARNLHLAGTRFSLLESSEVRQLLTGNKRDSEPLYTDFSNLNLSGINLAGRQLANYNFSHANLANANFANCILTHAQLTAANVTGANFCGANLTGAIIDNWNIDPHTRFDAATSCEFVWLGLKQNSQERERNPPSGEFKPGEFAKLYQQVSDTIDFILHNRDELDAIMRSVAHLKEHGAEIEVESVERKNDSVVLRLKAPPSVSREQIYSDVKHEQSLQLALAEKEVQMLTRERDNLSTLLIGIANRPLNFFNQQGADMSQTNVNQTGNTFTQSPVGIGQSVNINQSIAALPEAQSELKTLLSQLTKLIEQSQLPAPDKKDALQQTEVIIAAAQDNASPQKSRVKRALDYISGIFSGIEEAGAVTTQIQELVGQISDCFGK